MTDTCEDDAVGEAYWLVFLNLGDGFDPTPINWAVPGADYDGAETFDLTTEAANCDGQATPYYLTVDLDADGAPELLLTDLCDVGGAGDVGEDHWLVYDNTGTGFATTPTEWTLPGNSFYGNETFDRPANDSDCGSDAQPAYGLADLNGDDALDLVIMDHCTVPEIGEGSGSTASATARALLWPHLRARAPPAGSDASTNCLASPTVTKAARRRSACAT